MLSIGGYLHLPGKGLIKQVGERIYSIDFKDYPLARRYLEMNELMDISHINKNFSKSTANETQVAVEDLYSDNHIIKLLTLTQSFFIVVNTDQLFVDMEKAESTDLPGRYITYNFKIPFSSRER